jgi:hypothetical protein
MVLLCCKEGGYGVATASSHSLFLVCACRNRCLEMLALPGCTHVRGGIVSAGLVLSSPRKAADFA